MFDPKENRELTARDRLLQMKCIWAIDYYLDGNFNSEPLLAKTREQARYMLTILKKENPSWQQPRLRRL